MTRIEKKELLNELLKLEEKNDIGNLTSSDRAEFQIWVKEALEQEPKKDMFDKIRTEIKCMEYIEGSVNNSDEYEAAKEDALEIIDKYRQVEQEPKTEWIPVSERLPKETGWYYVTFEAYGGERVACELSYRKPENYWTDKNISRKVLDNNEVIAWMPIPKPYKEG